MILSTRFSRLAAWDPVSSRGTDSVPKTWTAELAAGRANAPEPRRATMERVKRCIIGLSFLLVLEYSGRGWPRYSRNDVDLEPPWDFIAFRCAINKIKPEPLPNT